MTNSNPSSTSAGASVAALLPPKGSAIPYAPPASHLTGKHDPLYPSAIELVRKLNIASISSVQRHLRIGYNRAAYMLEAMEGTVVTVADAKGVRQVLPFTQGA